MTDNHPANGADAVRPPPQASHPPFPAVRLLYAIGFAILGWFVLWILFAIGIVQFVVLAINGKVNDELKAFSVNLVQYLWELLAFITFVRDEQPFPIGPFPRHA
ncbi:MAG: DUF4389 domain-containing protein [Rhizomicrobium sp.]